MKPPQTILLLLAVFMVFSLPVYAQQAVSPPSRVNVKFTAKYPEYANKANWQQTREGYTASFNDKGMAVSSKFTKDGQWLGTETKLQEKHWQPATRQYLSENHKGYRYLEGYKIDDDKGSRYQLDVESGSGRYRLHFDQNGNFVNETPIK